MVGGAGGALWPPFLHLELLLEGESKVEPHIPCIATGIWDLGSSCTWGWLPSVPSMGRPAGGMKGARKGSIPGNEEGP